MRAVVYHGPGNKALGGGADADACRTTPTPSCASMPSRSAGRTCTSSRATSQPSSQVASLATRRSARSSRSAPASRLRKPGDRVLVSCITACGGAGSAVKGATDNVSAVAAGSSVTRSTAPRRSTSASRSPTPPRTSPRRRLRRAAAHAGRHPPHRLRGRRPQRPRPPRRRGGGRRSWPDRAGSDDGCPPLQPEPRRCHRPRRQPARGGQAVRSRRDREQRPRGSAGRSSAT